MTHWLYVLWFSYGWPSDKGNGPEAIQEAAVVAVLTAVFVPLVRNFIKREFAKAHAELHAHGELLHAKLDHIIRHHPDIPDYEESK